MNGKAYIHLCPPLTKPKSNNIKKTLTKVTTTPRPKTSKNEQKQIRELPYFDRNLMRSKFASLTLTHAFLCRVRVMADKREIFAIGKIVVSIAILIRLMWYKLLRVQPIASQANVHLVIASDG